MLWQSGLFDAVGVAACGKSSASTRLPRFRSEASAAAPSYCPISAKGGVAVVVFAESLYGLVDDALRTRMPVMFVL